MEGGHAAGRCRMLLPPRLATWRETHHRKPGDTPGPQLLHHQPCLPRRLGHTDGGRHGDAHLGTQGWRCPLLEVAADSGRSQETTGRLGGWSGKSGFASSLEEAVDPALAGPFDEVVHHGGDPDADDAGHNHSRERAPTLLEPDADHLKAEYDVHQIE